MRRTGFRWLFLLLLLPLQSLSQQVFEHITTANGLSNNVVNAVLQDREGFYWIATVDGLNRFDGSAFKVFRHEKNNPNSLAHNLCNYLVEDDNGDIWVGTYDGVSIYRKKEGRFQNIYLQLPGFKSDILNRISALVKDEEGNIWIGSQALWKYDSRNSMLKYIENNPATNTTISDNSSITSLCYDKKNRGIWVRTADAINFLDLSSGQFFHRKHNPKKWKIFDIETEGKLAIDDRGERLWFFDAASKSFDFVDLATGQIRETAIRNHPFPRIIQTDNLGHLWLSFWQEEEKSLSYDPITGTVDSNFLFRFHSRSALSPKFNQLYTDKFNNIWVSSGKGISIYNPSYQFFSLYELNLPDFLLGTIPFDIADIAPWGNKGFWVGSSKKGLYQFNFETRTLIKMNHPMIDFPLGCLYEQNDSILWASTSSILYKIQSKTGTILSQVVIDRTIQFITSDNAGNIWLGDWNNGLYKLTGKGDVLKHYYHEDSDPGSLPDDHLVCVTNRFNEIWIGMNRGSGFARYIDGKDRFLHFNPRASDSSNKDFGTVTGIATADGNNFMIGTHGGGVYVWNRNSNSFKQFDENDGLDGIFINSILPDKNGNYWICTSNGINFFDQKTRKFSPLKIDFAFGTNAFNGNAVAAPDGKVLMFCRNKVIEINPGLYSFSDTGTHTLISSFKVFDEEKSSLLKSSSIHLNHKQNFFSFEYSALKSNPVSDSRYAYKLDGFEKNWNDAGTRRYAAYTNVPAGSYHFLVKSANENGVWSNDITSVSIIISPPFWKTWWFYTLIAFFIGTLLYGIYSYRINQLKKLMAMRARISQDLHDEVGSTLSSIHLYSSVAARAMEKDTRQAKDALGHIDKNTRRVMEDMSDIVWAINTGQIGEITLESKLKNYGYELLTPLNIECSYHVDKEAEKRLVNLEARKNILMIVKEAMNNIAKYSGATHAKVLLELHHRNLKLIISDNGKGFNETGTHSGNGLHNMQKRTEALGGDFSYRSGEDKGMTVECKIPLTNISE